MAIKNKIPKAKSPGSIRLSSKTDTVSMRFSSQTDTYTSLGKEIKISPKSKVAINKAGFKMEFLVPTADILIGIGKDHVAWLVMEPDALEALKSGAPINIDTLKDFKSKLK